MAFQVLSLFLLALPIASIACLWNRILPSSLEDSGVLQRSASFPNHQPCLGKFLSTTSMCDH